MRSWSRRAVWAALLGGLVGLIAGRVACGSHRAAAPPAGGAAADDARRQATRQLIAGRLSLLDAAAAFRDADAAEPRRWKELANSLGDGSGDEGYCRSVIEWVRVEAPPGRADDLVRALEGELAARRRDGTLRVRAAPSAPTGTQQ